MNPTLTFVRIIIVLLSVAFMITYAAGTSAALSLWTYIWGAVTGLVIGALLIACDLLFKRFTLRAFNIVALGLLFGYLLGLALLAAFTALLDITSAKLALQTTEIIKIFIFLFGLYLGVVMTLRASDELYVSVPFVRFSPVTPKTKEVILDASALSDPRLIDLAASGLLDHRLILPRFLLKELYEQEETGDEVLRAKARRALDVIKKLESLPELHLLYHDTDFPDVKESSAKVLRLARFLNANVITADTSRAQMPPVDGVRVINVHALSSALKPLMQRGEFLKIKIQRYGKEDRQGVGYLEDGTMVVVNGGGDHIGTTIKARVLSVKHTSSGRMIFCNVADEEFEDFDDDFEEDDY